MNRSRKSCKSVAVIEVAVCPHQTRAPSNATPCPAARHVLRRSVLEADRRAVSRLLLSALAIVSFSIESLALDPVRDTEHSSPAWRSHRRLVSNHVVAGKPLPRRVSWRATSPSAAAGSACFEARAGAFPLPQFLFRLAAVVAAARASARASRAASCRIANARRLRECC